mmetsp:Transcript_5360/g.17279  ORF Transcript_5360/g.17279 Transcript_5360/m.17279 type:complete len:245 (+) Transcript_5360:827-1561(+)
MSAKAANPVALPGTVASPIEMMRRSRKEQPVKFASASTNDVWYSGCVATMSKPAADCRSLDRPSSAVSARTNACTAIATLSSSAHSVATEASRSLISTPASAQATAPAGGRPAREVFTACASVPGAIHSLSPARYSRGGGWVGAGVGGMLRGRYTLSGTDRRSSGVRVPRSGTLASVHDAMATLLTASPVTVDDTSAAYRSSTLPSPGNASTVTMSRLNARAATSRFPPDVTTERSSSSKPAGR